ncbi:hypothetical protein [Microbispora sp. H10885]|uniref:hypothetical protein n=1 Tax=Microbispora sp. H10885 TaxID=2729110 RepID=UPI0016042303|nr:hypothetical protein [Microbispora sp. H10885]
MVTNVTNSNMPDLTRLQQLLEESKTVAASGEAMLRDPEGFRIRKQAQDTLEQALRNRRIDVAQEAARILENLNEKEAELRRALVQQAAVDSNAEKVIREVREEFGHAG